jgi:hypothetical protein
MADGGWRMADGGWRMATKLRRQEQQSALVLTIRYPLSPFSALTPSASCLQTPASTCSSRLPLSLIS